MHANFITSSYIEAAEDLGASPWQQFFKVEKRREKWEGQRNKAIIETLFSCGLRVSELVNLKKSDVFEEEKFIRIIGKGNKERIVPISGKALKEINLWYMDRNLIPAS